MAERVIRPNVEAARLVNLEHWNRGNDRISGLLALEYATGIDTHQPECVGENRTVADETTSIDDAAVRVNRRYRMASVQGDDLGAGARTIMRLSQSSAHRCPVSVARPADPSSTRRCKSRRSSTSGLRRSVMAPARTSSFSSISISTSRPRATSASSVRWSGTG